MSPDFNFIALFVLVSNPLIYGNLMGLISHSQTFSNNPYSNLNQSNFLFDPHFLDILDFKEKNSNLDRDSNLCHLRYPGSIDVYRHK